MLQKINNLILDIYQKSFCNDLVLFRDQVCESINTILPFDTISWHYLDSNGKAMGTICQPLLEDNELLPPLEALNPIRTNSHNHSKAGLVTIDHEEHQLTALITSSNTRRNHQVKLIRKLDSQRFSDNDKKLFELTFPHMVEGLSMVLMNKVKQESSIHAIGIIDKNHNIIEANNNFISLLSPVIKHNKLLVNLSKSQKNTVFDDMTITHVADFYFINADMNKQRRLTKQEHKIMVLLTTGATNNFMAKELQISSSTINNHLTHIFKKLKVNNRISAVNEWNQHDK